uniref:Uncharacterized protein n=1 Tax=Acetobacter pasteurianus TaxID=438 RepID=I3W0B2_ACEPA|nr:hypothetical protein [Acetobacter pasteurianus]
MNGYNGYRFIVKTHMEHWLFLGPNHSANRKRLAFFSFAL